MASHWYMGMKYSAPFRSPRASDSHSRRRNTEEKSPVTAAVDTLNRQLERAGFVLAGKKSALRFQAGCHGV